MIGALSGIRLYAAIGVAVAFALLLGWALHLDHLRAGWKGAHDKLASEAAKVVIAIKEASDNPGLKWADAAGQVEQIGMSRKAWKGTAQLQSARIDELGIETARLKALNADLRKKAEAQIAKRDKAIARLESSALTPGERSDCARQLREAEEALDLVYAEGL